MTSVSSGSSSSASTTTSTGSSRSARRVVERETGNPLTTGVRFDPERLTSALVEAAGGIVRDAAAGVRLRSRFASRRRACR